jgi:hypothetical protein
VNLKPTFVGVTSESTGHLLTLVVIHRHGDWSCSSLTFPQILSICEKVTRRKLLGSSLPGRMLSRLARQMSARCAHFSRGVRNAG